MLKDLARRAVRRLGYDLLMVPRPELIGAFELRAAFPRYARCHYACAFEGGISFATPHNTDVYRTERRASRLIEF